jgi:hydrogenase maturation protein HypF
VIRSPHGEEPLQARDIVVTGRVQAVGFRPFVYQTAHVLGLTGSVQNGSGKVFIHAQGTAQRLDQLQHALIHSAPPLARPVLASSKQGTWRELDSFSILASDSSTAAQIHLPPDLFTCDDCLAELTTPSERRFQYPFINCTQCGPRYTIITALPYDRPNTSLAGFPLCAACQREYGSPLDRRFHAQPLACPDCGPCLEFVRNGAPLAAAPDCDAAVMEAAVTALRQGDILAVKGVGGYHLVCDAANDAAVQRLRKRKQRPHKPLAVMFPLRGTDGLDAVRAAVQLDELTARAILDPARPIVLARGREQTGLSPLLAPGLRELGVFLPYSPLHHQLLQRYGRPLVATSGNISGEPVITDNHESAQRLASIADGFVHHNRPIVRPADDPVIRPIAGQARVIRLGRGIAPLERELPATLDVPTLAVGGHMKVTVALAWDDRVVISPHLGDLGSPRSMAVFARLIADLQNLYAVNCRQIVSDLHPGYASSRWAQQQGLPVLRVQHHEAHASALAGEHQDISQWLVFTWDGVGYGHDGQFWGGEALAGRPGCWNRLASFRPFRVVGGDRAGREPWRSAAALLWAEGVEWRPPVEGVAIAREAWDKDIGVFTTSAVGRLFDAAAALVLDRQCASFEGQGPMELEHVSSGAAAPVGLPLLPDGHGVLRSDWAPLLPILMDERRSRAERAHVFHASMAQALADQAVLIHQRQPFQAIGLSGGVFQNRRLTELVLDRLQLAGFDCRLHRDIPANDGGLCFGQVMEALAGSEHRLRLG